MDSSNVIVDEVVQGKRCLGGYGWARVEVADKERWVASGVFLDDDPTAEGVMELYNEFLQEVA